MCVAAARTSFSVPVFAICVAICFRFNVGVMVNLIAFFCGLGQLIPQLVWITSSLCCGDSR